MLKLNTVRSMVCQQALRPENIDSCCTNRTYLRVRILMPVQYERGSSWPPYYVRYFRRKMGRSYLDNYPAYATCCCVNLRLGAFIISILGHIPSILYLLFCATGIEQLTKYGVSRIAAQIIVVTFIVLSLTSIPMHILLLIAALKYNERLVLIYQWFIVLYLSFDIQLIFVIVFMSLHKGFVMFSVSLLLWEVCSWLILCGIILPVVNGFRKRIRAMNI